MTGQEMLARLGEEGVGEQTTLLGEQGAEIRLRSSRESLRRSVSTVREAGYRLFIDAFAVDYSLRPERFEVVYQFTELEGAGQVFIHVSVPEDDPHVPSIADLVPGTNWPEREMYDLYGLIFDGHPNLKRLLLPEDWEGHPLRKDYPVRGTQPMPPIVHELEEV